MLKVEVPFGGENAKFGYKDGIFYYLIIFGNPGNDCGFTLLFLVHIVLTNTDYIFYIPGCTTPGIVPCVAHFSCNTSGGYLVFVSPERLPLMG
jgi:hypothetical protein